MYVHMPDWAPGSSSLLTRQLRVQKAILIQHKQTSINSRAQAAQTNQIGVIYPSTLLAAEGD